MEDLQTGGRFKDLRRKRVPEKGICRQAEPGTEPFAADGDHVSERVVQAGGLAGEFDAGEQVVDGFADAGFFNHGSIQNHQCAGGMGKGQADLIRGGAVERRLPPVVENNPDCLIFKTFRLDAEAVVGGE